jgi:hypothetical protein
MQFLLAIMVKKDLFKSFKAQIAVNFIIPTLVRGVVICCSPRLYQLHQMFELGLDVVLFLVEVWEDVSSLLY